jgi:VanZ family protein
LTSKNQQALKAWIAAGLWLGLIALESTSYASAANTGRFLYPLFHFIFGVSAADFAGWNGHLRKLGHFVGYFTLSALMFRAWKNSWPVRGEAWRWQWAAMALVVTAGVASLDEWHQTFLPSRTGTFHDVILDSSAALTAQVVIYILIARRMQAVRPA